MCPYHILNLTSHNTTNIPSLFNNDGTNYNVLTAILIENYFKFWHLLFNRLNSNKHPSVLIACFKPSEDVKKVCNQYKARIWLRLALITLYDGYILLREQYGTKLK